MIAAAHNAWGRQNAKCPRCREPKLREQWGCDAPAKWPIFSSTCPACLGAGCEECHNKGQVQHNRCPKSQSSDAASEIIRLASAVEAGFLPTAGGYGDQPGRIMRLIEIALHERGEIERAQAQTEKK